MRPSTRAPPICSCIRLIVRRSVLLPHPDGPISAVTARGGISSEMLLSARNERYQAFRPSMAMPVEVEASPFGVGTLLETEVCAAAARTASAPRTSIGAPAVGAAAAVVVGEGELGAAGDGSADGVG